MMKPSGSAGAIQKCQPVYVKADANVDLAQADAVATAQVFGLASQEIAVGESGAIQTDGIFTAADWTATTGAVTLTVGSSYFLDAASPGMLTTTAPTTGYNCKVGRAVSATDLDLNIRDSFKL
ncbi:MAG: capsid cement protein [Spirochaetota bacterium]